MRNTLAIAVCCSLLAACGVGSEETAGSSLTANSATTSTAGETIRSATSTSATATVVTSTTSTAIPVVPSPSTSTTSSGTTADVTILPVVPEGLTFLLYGDEGLYRVERGGNARLVDVPVQWAAGDYDGGALFRLAEEPALFWIQTGETEPVELEREPAPGNPVFTGRFDGRTVLFLDEFPGIPPPDGWPCPDGRMLRGFDLASGEDVVFLCLPTGDAGFDIRSFGGDLFVGTPYRQFDSWVFYSSIRFWNMNGDEVEKATNPFPSTQTCEPCELEAMISPDGRLLAYRYRPDALHPESPSLPVDFYDAPWGPDRWWEQSRQIPAAVAVVDLTTGEEAWSTEVDADVELSDFDGRYVVLHRRDWSSNPHLWVHIRIVDTWGEYPDVIIESPSIVSLVGRVR